MEEHLPGARGLPGGASGGGLLRGQGGRQEEELLRAGRSQPLQPRGTGSEKPFHSRNCVPSLHLLTTDNHSLF